MVSIWKPSIFLHPLLPCPEDNSPGKKRDREEAGLLTTPHVTPVRLEERPPTTPREETDKEVIPDIVCIAISCSRGLDGQLWLVWAVI